MKLFNLGKVIALSVALMIAATLLSSQSNAASPTGANANNLNVIFGVSPNSVQNGDTVNYTITVINPTMPLPIITADATNVVITFYKPLADGTPGDPVTIDSIASFPAGSTKVYDSTNAPALIVPLNLNSGVTTAYGKVTYTATILTSPTANTSGDKNVPVTIVPEIPEFGLISGAIALLSSGAGFILLKRRHN